MKTTTTMEDNKEEQFCATLYTMTVHTANIYHHFI